jgi:molybdopterin converting factor small subunit
VSESRVTVRLPRLLHELTGCEPELQAAGDTLRAVLEDLGRQRPDLGLYLLDESGRLRRHLRCSHNDTYTGRELDRPLEPGDTVTILHSVSGG